MKIFGLTIKYKGFRRKDKLTYSGVNPHMNNMQTYVDDISVENFSDIFSYRYNYLIVVSVYNNIKEVNKLLETAINNINNNNLITHYNFPMDVKKINISRFFIDSSNTYLDPVEEIRTFKILLLELIQLFLEKESTYDKSFILDKNLIIIGNIINSLTNVAKVFNNVKP